MEETKKYQVAVSDFVASGQMEAKLFAKIDGSKKKKVNNAISAREMLRRDLRTHQGNAAYYAAFYMPRIFSRLRTVPPFGRISQ